MTLLETLALLTLLAIVSFGIFDIAWKIFNNKNDRPQRPNLSGHLLIIAPERY
jgi:hypothetical protein